MKALLGEGRVLMRSILTTVSVVRSAAMQRTQGIPLPYNSLFVPGPRGQRTENTGDPAGGERRPRIDQTFCHIGTSSPLSLDHLLPRVLQDGYNSNRNNISSLGKARRERPVRRRGFWHVVARRRASTHGVGTEKYESE